MEREERRRSQRTEEVFPVSVQVTDVPKLEGRSVNFSSQGILLMARGSLELLVTIKDKQYRGRLVRAFPTEDGMTGYSVELEQLIETTDRSHAEAEAPVRDAEPVSSSV